MKDDRHRGLKLSAVLGLHAMLIGVLLTDQGVLLPEQGEAKRIQWVWVVPVPRAAPPRPSEPRMSRQEEAPALQNRHPAPPAIHKADTAESSPSISDSADVATKNPPPDSLPSVDTGLDARDLIMRARQLAGSVDQQLRRETNQKPAAPVDTPYSRFVAGIEAAVAPTWTGIATVTEIAMPGTGERMYKVSNGKGTYCIRIPAAKVGIDRYEWERNNYRPVSCPR